MSDSLYINPIGMDQLQLDTVRTQIRGYHIQADMDLTTRVYITMDMANVPVAHLETMLGWLDTQPTILVHKATWLPIEAKYDFQSINDDSVTQLRDLARNEYQRRILNLPPMPLKAVGPIPDTYGDF